MAECHLNRRKESLWSAIVTNDCPELWTVLPSAVKDLEHFWRVKDVALWVSVDKFSPLSFAQRPNDLNLRLFCSMPHVFAFSKALSVPVSCRGRRFYKVRRIGTGKSRLQPFKPLLLLEQQRPPVRSRLDQLLRQRQRQ